MFIIFVCTVPSSPTVVVIPHYSYSTREFVGLTVKFNQLVRFSYVCDSMLNGTMHYFQH